MFLSHEPHDYPPTHLNDSLLRVVRVDLLIRRRVKNAEASLLRRPLLRHVQKVSPRRRPGVVRGLGDTVVVVDIVVDVFVENVVGIVVDVFVGIAVDDAVTFVVVDNVVDNVVDVSVDNAIGVTVDITVDIGMGGGSERGSGEAEGVGVRRRKLEERRGKGEGGGLPNT